jgi:hypothetical protein
MILNFEVDFAIELNGLRARDGGKRFCLDESESAGGESAGSSRDKSLSATDESLSATDESSSARSDSPARGGLQRGDLHRGDLARGDLVRGNLGRGDLARDNLAKGDLARDDLAKGDSPATGDLGDELRTGRCTGREKRVRIAKSNER